MKEDYYDILGISKNASTAEIRIREMLRLKKSLKNRLKLTKYLAMKINEPVTTGLATRHLKVAAEAEASAEWIWTIYSASLETSLEVASAVAEASLVLVAVLAVAKDVLKEATLELG